MGRHTNVAWGQEVMNSRDEGLPWQIEEEGYTQMSQGYGDIGVTGKLISNVTGGTGSNAFQM